MDPSTVVLIGSTVGLGLMFWAGNRWGDMRHHQQCPACNEGQVKIPIDFEAAVMSLDEWSRKPRPVDGYDVVEDIMKAAFPGQIVENDGWQP